MNSSSDKAFNYLTGKENMQDLPLEDLQKLVDENPFFPVTQFLLAKKLKTSNASEEVFLLQAQKTALYFSNPYWLNFQLSGELVDSPNLKEQQSFGEVNDSDPSDAAVLKPEDQPLSVQSHVERHEILNNAANENSIANTETALPDAVETTIVELEEEMAGVAHEMDESTEQFLEELEEGENNHPNAEQDDEHDKMFQNIKAMLDASSEEADADIKNALIPMDPYYTIDYFASQGIKLEFDQNPQDQLGQNLKKFTQWLKHMKKLGPEDATEAIIQTETEADIQQFADSSNKVREVVTEAMASVLEKQGEKAKAIELYNKLSFLYPHKNAYFADKINKLKGI